MAYNILKGNVDGSVDQHADQEISGIKIFKSTISASVFYDTDAQSPCATMKDVAIKKIKGGTQDGILICDTESGAKTSHSFRYSGDTLIVQNIKTNTVSGDASNLVKIPADKFLDKISANFINHDYGLRNVDGQLQAKVAEGLKCDDDGIEIDLFPNSCLSIKNNKLIIDPVNADSINKNGQNLSDDDLLMVADVSTGNIKNTTLANIYSSYINSRIPHAVGTLGEIQFKGKKEFKSHAGLRFEEATNTLHVAGKLKSNTIVSKSKMVCEGAIYQNITTTSNELYVATEYDYTIVCDASDNKVTVNLPAPQNNRGRIIVVKKANKDKYKLNSNLVNVACSEGRIDINNITEIKMNFSTKTFQSDGENWWIIGSYGS